MKSLKFWLIWIAIFWITFLFASALAGMSRMDPQISMLGAIAFIFMGLCVYMEAKTHHEFLYKVVGCFIIVIVTFVLGYFTYKLSILINSSTNPIAQKQQSAMIYALFQVIIFQFAYILTSFITHKTDR